MGHCQSTYCKMKTLYLVLAFVVAISCDSFTIGQVATGYTDGGVNTDVDYGHGLASGLRAIVKRDAVACCRGGRENCLGCYYYNLAVKYGWRGRGKRDADGEAYVIGHPPNILGK